MSTAAAPAQRRKLQFSTLDELRADIEAVSGGPYTTVGNWSFAQILDHLADTMNSSIDGFPFKAPWFFRWCIAPLIKNSILTRPMKAGHKLPKKYSSFLPSEDCTIEEALPKVLNAIKRFETETPTADHPGFGKMASEEWTQLHLRHAELHMSFVVPTETPGEAD